MAVLVEYCSALDPFSIYEQVANAPHDDPELFFRNNPLVPDGNAAYGNTYRGKAPDAPDVDGRPPPGPVNPPRQKPAPGVHFSSVFSDFAVLQRAPAQAALYGIVVPPPAAGSVSITVSPPMQGKKTFASGLNAQGEWKVLLPPMPAGGEFNAILTCPDCANKTATVISNLTFGDIVSGAPCCSVLSGENRAANCA